MNNTASSSCGKYRIIVWPVNLEIMNKSILEFLYWENLIIQPLRSTGCHDLVLEATSRNLLVGVSFVFGCIFVCMRPKNLTLLVLELVLFRWPNPNLHRSLGASYLLALLILFHNLNGFLMVSHTSVHWGCTSISNALKEKVYGAKDFFHYFFAVNFSTCATVCV